MTKQKKIFFLLALIFLGIVSFDSYIFFKSDKVIKTQQNVPSSAQMLKDKNLQDAFAAVVALKENSTTNNLNNTKDPEFEKLYKIAQTRGHPVEINDNADAPIETSQETIKEVPSNTALQSDFANEKFKKSMSSEEQVGFLEILAAEIKNDEFVVSNLKMSNDVETYEIMENKLKIKKEQYSLLKLDAKNFED